MSESKTRIPEVDSEHEPEYVGAYAEPLREACAGVTGDYVEDIEFCDADATHTVVMRDPNGELHEIAMCDACGEPGDATLG